jgi:hypothetical protein
MHRKRDPTVIRIVTEARARGQAHGWGRVRVSKVTTGRVSFFVAVVRAYMIR